MELRFLEEPFIPKSKVKLMLIDGRASEDILDKLSSFGIDFILTQKNPNVSESVSYHPDIQVYPLGNGSFISCPESLNYLSEKLSQYRCEIIPGETSLKSNYPVDAAYNVARIGKLCLHNFKYTEPLILKEIENKSFQKVNIKQGYSKCSTAILNDSAIITSDNGIHKAALKNGIDSLLISPGHINLPGESYGFIGGCSGLIAPDIFAVTGCLDKHPDYKAIVKFIGKQQLELVFLSSKEPIDLGSLIPVLEMNSI